MEHIKEIWYLQTKPVQGMKKKITKLVAEFSAVSFVDPMIPFTGVNASVNAISQNAYKGSYLKCSGWDRKSPNKAREQSTSNKWQRYIKIRY